jgi:hypothetical protein
MQRVVTAKRSVALAVAGLVVGTVGALSVPALADNAPAAHRAANIPTMVLNFNGTNDEAGAPQQVGSAFGGRATVKDANGNQIGEAYDVCSKDAINAKDDTAFCTGMIRIYNKGEISFSTVLGISDDAANPDRAAFGGVVNGGDKEFEGITGEVKFTPKEQGVFEANFN